MRRLQSARFSLLPSIFGLLLLTCYSPLQAQSLLPLDAGVATVTCFAGYIDDSSNVFLDPDAYVMGIVDIRNAPPGMAGQDWMPPMYHHPSWTARNLGQIFGLAYDDLGNIYVTATAMYSPPVDLNRPGVFGPAGPGGIYKIDGQTGVISTFASLPNTWPALGNICFDRDHHQFFVSNFEDGKIYRLDMNGRVLSTFDHGQPDDNRAGIVPLGERVWGIGYYNNTIYYAIYNEDWEELLGPSQLTTANAVWSVKLDAAGDIDPRTNLREWTAPLYNRNRADGRSAAISDIAFKPDGTMLLGEVTMFYDFGATEWYGRTIEVTQTNGIWTGLRLFFTGVPGLSTNTQGGIDYGYQLNLPPSQATGYQSVWSTANPLHHPNVANAGITGVPASGNNLGNVATTSYFIDADGVLEKDGYKKALMGDIEIYKIFTLPTVNDTLRICEGETVELDPGGARTWEWSGGPGISCLDCRKQTVSPTIQTTYRVDMWRDLFTRQTRTFTVIPTAAITLTTSISTTTPRTFGDTVNLYVLADKPGGLANATSLQIDVDYQPLTMRAVGATVDSIGNYQTGYYIDGWTITSIVDDGVGTIRLLCAPSGGSRTVNDTLAAFPFVTFLPADLSNLPSSAVNIQLAARVGINGINCLTHDEFPGFLQLQLPPVPPEYDTICAGESRTLDGGPGLSWSWSAGGNSGSMSCTDCRNPVVTPATSTDYQVSTALGPALSTTKVVHIEVKPRRNLVTTVRNLPVHQFGDTVEIELRVNNLTPMSRGTKLTLDCHYEPLTMRSYGATVDSMPAFQIGTAIEGWTITTVTDDGLGTVHLEAVPPAGGTTTSAIPLARFRFITFVNGDPGNLPESAWKIPLTFELDLEGLDCFDHSEAPGLLELDLDNTSTEMTICAGDSLILDGGDGVAWDWGNGENLSCLDCRNPVARPTSSTIYTVVTTLASGLTQERTTTVTVIPVTHIDLSVADLGSHYFGDTVDLPLLVEDPASLADVRTLDVTVTYQSLTMRGIGITDDSIMLYQKNAIIDGWTASIVDNGAGTIHLLATKKDNRPPTSDTLLRLRFATGLWSDPMLLPRDGWDITLSATLDIGELVCYTIDEQPGALLLKLPPTSDTISICEESQLTFDAGPGRSWKWSPSHDLDCDTCRTVTAVIHEDEETWEYVATYPGELVQEGSYTVQPISTTYYDTHIGTYGPILIGDTIMIDMMLDDTIARRDISGLEVSIDYDRGGMLPVDFSAAEIEERLPGTLLEGWSVTRVENIALDDRHGRLSIRLVPLFGPSLLLADTGRLLPLRFATFLGFETDVVIDSLGKIKLPFTFDLEGPDCIGVRKDPGLVELTICGLQHRLIEMTFSKYAISMATSPVREVGRLDFSLGLDGPTRLELIDLQGRVVKELVREDLDAGEYTIRWESNDLPSGIYFYHLSSGAWEGVEKIVIER